MIGMYSRPASGYMSLWPVADLGSDLVVALWKAGVRKTDAGIPVAKGFALLVVDGGKLFPIRTKSQSLSEARGEAVKYAANSGEVLLLEAVAKGGRTLFRRRETVLPLSIAMAAGDNNLSPIGPFGGLVEKDLSPFVPTDQRVIADRLAAQIGYYERKALGNKLTQWAESLDHAWGKLTPNQVSQTLTSARNRLRTLMNGTANTLLPVWKTKIEATLTQTVRDTKTILRTNFIPQIGQTFSQPDMKAVKNLAEQQGFWIRDAAGVRADHLTAQGQKIIQDGLHKGLGREEIARNLQTALPDAWQKRGMSYFKTLSSVSVSRARSYSEVTGYIEAGIESIEIQAILDERTTDICRCLDGQVIRVELVSQQFINTMSLANPEDIKDASPFLRVINRDVNGVNTRSIVTENTKTPIADIVRSGMGRVDDRGQFSRYIANNQLVAANIGPPPYHHLCRSWTLPISSTVQVPQNMIPRAKGPVSPVPPREVKPGGKIPPGVGPRPQNFSPKPSQTKPTMTGDAANIDRYPFTQDFITPPKLPSVDLGAKGMKSGAIYQRYVLDVKAQAIRAIGELNRVTLPADINLGPLGNLRTQLSLTADTSGVVMHVAKINAESLKEIVLAEWGQPAGRRIYTVISEMTGSKQYLKFNHDIKASVESKLWKKELVAAKTTDEIAKALANLELKGFLKMTTNPSEVIFGVPKASMPKLRGVPKPKPPAPPIKPVSPLTPTNVPKPKPTVVEPRIPGQPLPAPKLPRPKPLVPKPSTLPPHGSVDPYSVYRLDEKISIKTQFETRVRLELSRLNDALAGEMKRVGGNFSKEKKEQFIRDYCRKATGEVGTIKLAEVNKATYAMTVKDKKILESAVKTKLATSPTVYYKGVVLQPKITQVSDALKMELWNDASSHLSPTIWEALKAKGLPRIHLVDGYTGGAWYQATTNTMVFGNNQAMVDLKICFRHELGHAIDTLGRNDLALKYATDRWSNGNTVYRSAGGWSYRKGAWAHDYMGRVYENTKYGEVHSVMNEMMAMGTGNASTGASLLQQYEVNPESIGHWIAWANGAYLP